MAESFAMNQSSESEPILNPAVIAELRTLEGPDEEGSLLSILEEKFDRDGHLQLDLFRTSLESGDLDKAWRAVHTLKGMALNLGANRLVEQAKAIEQDGRLGNVDACAQARPALETEFSRALEALRALLPPQA
jgi:HPt (histidine-containing phosphotransfer) domain-containing protein